MAFDVAKWLREDMGFSEDDAKGLSEKFGGKADVLEKGYLRQSDYSKQMNGLKKTQDDLQAASDKLNADIAEWGQLTAAEKAEATGLRDRIEKADGRVFELTQKITRLAEDAGRDPKEFLGSDPSPAPKPKPDATADLDPLRQQIGGLGEYMLTLSADMPAIEREHFELTGERLDTRKFIAGIREDFRKGRTQNVDPWKRWETEYGIPAKREEKREQAITARVEARYQEGLVAGRSEAALPNTRPVGRSESSSPVLARAVGQSKLQRPQPTDRQSGALAALREGRYRNAGPGGVMPRQQ